MSTFSDSAATAFGLIGGVRLGGRDRDEGPEEVEEGDVDGGQVVEGPDAHVEQVAGRRDLRVEVPTQPRPWPAGAGPRCAAVSSFGMGGTNVHLVVEEAPDFVKRVTAVMMAGETKATRLSGMPPGGTTVSSSVPVLARTRAVAGSAVLGKEQVLERLPEIYTRFILAVDSHPAGAGRASSRLA